MKVTRWNFIFLRGVLSYLRNLQNCLARAIMSYLYLVTRVITCLFTLMLCDCSSATQLNSAFAAPLATSEKSSMPHGSQHHHHDKPGFHRSFDDAEKWSKKFDDPARDEWQKPDETIKALGISATDKIVDIGAGTGYFSLRIAKAYPDVIIYAADIEPSMIEYLQKQTDQRALSNHVPVLIDPQSLKLPSKVNLALVVDTYHHIDNRISYFSALKNHLLANGRVAIVDFTPESPEGPPADHRISKTDLQSELKEAGFVLDQEFSILPYQYFLTFKVAETK